MSAALQDNNRAFPFALAERSQDHLHDRKRGERTSADHCVALYILNSHGSRASEIAKITEPSRRRREDEIGLFSGYNPGTERYPGTPAFCGHGNSLIRRRSVFVLSNGNVRSDSSKRDRNIAADVGASFDNQTDLSDECGDRI